MRASENYLPTLKETPHDAEIVSHQLMLRAGLIRKLGSGLYTWLPLGLKILRKVEHLVRSEMQSAGALEILMPAVQPAELWQETGRWETFGGQLLTMKDSQGRDYCFGPTHEEVVTDLIRQDIRSYKQLPVTVYQIQTKFRDEIRPRFGVMRAREFLMKDAYSFHLTQDSLEATYARMHTAYSSLFQRLGLNFRAVEADTGAIGGAVSHEFQVLADAGEDIIAYSNGSNYAANIEQATSLCVTPAALTVALPMISTSTPGKKTIDEVSEFLNIDPALTIKTLIVAGKDNSWVAIHLRGDDQLNPVKAGKHPLVQAPICFADDSVLESLHLHKGFIGPVELKLLNLVDFAARALPEFVCGANQHDAHYQHAAWIRDAKCDDVFDFRTVKSGDLSPDGHGSLELCRGIEVGHIFQLGEKYADAMHTAVLNEQGKLETLRMGCYGLGISRIVAAAIEQNHDERGICWPAAMAPFKWVIIPINANRCVEVQQAAERLYLQMLENDQEVLLEDRNERPGVLFADHDLIGIPHRIVISERHLNAGVVEYKSRVSGEVQHIALDVLWDFITH